MSKNKKVLFLQITEPGAYPPLIHASEIFAEKSWFVYFLSAPIKNKNLRINKNSKIQEIRLRERDSHVVGKLFLLFYTISSIIQVLKIRPNLIYASDPITTIPATLASCFGLVKVVYHEHDSPNSQKDLNIVIRFFRYIMVRISKHIVFPNENRGLITQRDLRFNPGKMKIIWNTPRIISSKVSLKENRNLKLYYHGSINKERLPEKLFQVISELHGKVKIIIAGYEAPGSIGYIDSILKKYNLSELHIKYLGQVIHHNDLINHAQSCDVGLGFMPMQSSDINMSNMFGASNKVFEYMSFGLPVLVSKIDDWIDQIEVGGFGKCCDVNSKESLMEGLNFFIQLKRDGRYKEMSLSCKKKINNEWNYRKGFMALLDKL